VKEVPVIKEVRVEVPVEVIRTVEKEVIKIVEVIREVPVEVIRTVEVEKPVEVEVIKHVPVEVVREVVRDNPRVVEVPVLREVPMGHLCEHVVERRRGEPHPPKPMPKPKPKPGNRPRPKVVPVVEESNRARVAGGHKVWGDSSSRLKMDLFKGRFPWRDSSLVAPMEHADVGFAPGLEHRRETRSREGSPTRPTSARAQSSPQRWRSSSPARVERLSSSRSSPPRDFERGEAQAAWDYVEGQMEYGTEC